MIQKAGCESNSVQIDFTSCRIRKQKKTGKKRASPLAVQGDAKHYNRPKSGWAGPIEAKHREEERKTETK